MEQQPDRVQSQRGITIMPVLAACCGVAAVAGLGLLIAERNQVRTLDQDRVQAAVALDTAKLQIQDLTNRLNTLAEKSSTPEKSSPAPAVLRTDSRRRSASASRPKAARPTAVDPRMERLQGQLAETQQELASTRDQ